ncbi:MAG: hypothetical protein DI617_09050 [Streptococcus pyogenes]|nr:MAG: hypothetical protein DI617_09050 [Streptococcus pyogenes]
MSSAQKQVEFWCNNAGLSVNPQKTTMVAFTKRKLLNLKRITFFNQVLVCSDEVKFLGVYFDRNLNWNKHFNYCLKKAKKAFWTCRNAIGRNWGLSPKTLIWIYSMIICPIITYGAVVWWSRTTYDAAKSELIKLQRMLCVAITGCLKTTPTATLELLLGLHPLYMRIEAEAILSMKRLMCFRQWKEYSGYLSWGKLDKDISSLPFLDMPSDSMLAEYAFDKPFKVQFPSQEEWCELNNDRNIKSNCSFWYTDGSKIGCSTEVAIC